jgi:hypothetical protein
MVTIRINETNDLRRKKAFAEIFINGAVEYTEFDDTFRVPVQTVNLLRTKGFSFNIISSAYKADEGSYSTMM